VEDPAVAWVSVSGRTSPVETRPVDLVEPRFTSENGERAARTKQGNGDRGGFLAGTGFGNGCSMLGSELGMGMDDRFSAGSGFEKARSGRISGCRPLGPREGRMANERGERPATGSTGDGRVFLFPCTKICFNLF